MSQRSENAASLSPPAPEAEGKQSAEAEAAGQTTSVMGFDDLEEFRQATRVVPPVETEADRITPTGPLRSPFASPGAHSPLMASGVPGTGPHADAETKPPARARATESALVRSFREASWPKRVTVLLLPIVIGLYGLKAWRHSAGKAHASTPSLSSSSAAAPSATASAITNASATATSDESATREAGLPASPRSPDASEPRVPGKTLQRRAVDAFASGNFQEAAALYQRLATENPNQPAYRAARQIAEDKANGVGHD